MPIDSNIIPNTLKGFNTPFERLDKMVSAQQTQSVNAARDAQTNKLRQEQAEQEALRRMLAETGGDLSDETLNRMVAIAPITGTKLAGDIIKQRKEMLDATKVELDTEWQQTTRGIQLLQAAKQNPTLYTQVRAQAIAKGGDLAELLRQHPTYDPSVVESLLHSGITTEKYLEINRNLMEGFAKGDYRHFAGAVNFVKDDPKELEELVNAARMAGMPKALIDATLANPEALSQTEAERQQGADRDATREQQAVGQQITLRGQDLSAATARRGQDISAANAAAARELTRRGQDLTNARAKEAGASGAKLSVSAIEKIAGVDQSMGMLDDIERLLPSMSGSIGPIDGRVAKGKIMAGAGVSTDLATFDAQLTGLKNAVIKATTGAQMSEPEAKRIMGQLPDLAQPESIFKARMATTRKNLALLKRRTIELSGGTVEPDAPKTPEQRPIPGIPGGVAELRDGRWIRVK